MAAGFEEVKVDLSLAADISPIATPSTVSNGRLCPRAPPDPFETVDEVAIRASGGSVVGARQVSEAGIRRTERVGLDLGHIRPLGLGA